MCATETNHCEYDTEGETAPACVADNGRQRKMGRQEGQGESLRPFRGRGKRQDGRGDFRGTGHRICLLLRFLGRELGPAFRRGQHPDGTDVQRHEERTPDLSRQRDALCGARQQSKALRLAQCYDRQYDGCHVRGPFHDRGAVSQLQRPLGYTPGRREDGTRFD